MARSYPSNFIDLTGKTFFRLTVIERIPPNPQGLVLWKCRCACGKEKIVRSQSLRAGNTKSCGCLHDELTRQRFTIHGFSKKIPEYKVWLSMRDRCHNPRNKKFSDYGGRGITVCERWNSFENFLSDMGQRPSPKHSIDRKNNDRGYTNDNCAWATQIEQKNNTRRNRYLTFNGITITIAEWGRKFGITPNLIAHRLRAGFTIEEALTKNRFHRIGNPRHVHKEQSESNK